MYNLILKTFFLKEKNRLFRRIWHYANNYTTKHYNGPVVTKIHGFNVNIKSDYPYSLITRQYNSFNNPLLELINFTFINKKATVNIIDIGAAIGDTALFTLANSNIQINKIYCIDGDDEFFGYLTNNTKNLKKISAYKALLSDGSSQNEAELIRTHSGTASAQGVLRKEAISLDKLMTNLFEPEIRIDVIKIDVDGFDGKVIAGSIDLLKRFRPNIIFEWHPLLYSITNNDVNLPFQILQQQGYENFIWYDKYGNFSHFDLNHSIEETDLMRQVCINGRHDYDWHYDIVAIPPTDYSLISLAEMQYAKNKKSPY
jgi:FkbM family methyltransferase